MSLGTFEFLVRESPPEFYFLEVNPRLQVEHTITESICMGLDLVKVQLQIATGQDITSLLAHLPEDPRIPPPLHSVQLRITAEDASNDWSLSVGKISNCTLPSGNGIRIDTNLVPSMVVKTDFDSLLAKIIVTSHSWADVVAKAERALADTNIEGVTTTLNALRGIISHPDFATQSCDTQWLETSLPTILKTGKSLAASLPKRSLASSTQQTTAISASSSSMLFRKGDAWSITLTPESQTSPSVPSEIQSHLQIARVLRNDFPSSLSASVIYTTPSGATPYTLSLSATNASAAALASSSKHRRGNKANPNHIIIPFPGQLVEIMVDEGDVIAKGEVVAVVRQMKMELEIRSSKGGLVVWAFEGEEGEEVAEGCLVAEVVDENAGSSKL
jgi:acetyl/propionyl-CoA carboxylase alpha subunit